MTAGEWILEISSSLVSFGIRIERLGFRELGFRGRGKVGKGSKGLVGGEPSRRLFVNVEFPMASFR